MQWDPAGFAAATAPSNPAEEAAQAAAEVERTRLRNHGIEELRILDGNVRYMRLTGFLWLADETGRAYDDAMRFLRDGDAVIIDLRDNGGGDASAVRYLVSHFFPGRDERLLMTFRDGEGGPEQSRVLGYLPAGRLVGKPLYVLISGNTGSAAEEFAYHVEQFHLGELIGQTTAGAGANNALFPLPPAFVLSVSISAPAHAVSGRTWDGVGVRPTTEASYATALDVAHQRALERLATTGPEARRAAWRWAGESAAARARPVSVPAAELARYAGRYGTAVSIRVADGELTYQRDGRPVIPLIPLGNGLFDMTGRPIRVRFTVEGGRVTDLHALTRDGGDTVMPRVGEAPPPAP